MSDLLYVTVRAEELGEIIARKVVERLSALPINKLDNGVYGIAFLFYDRCKNVCEAVYTEEGWEVRELTGATRRLLVWPGGLLPE